MKNKILTFASVLIASLFFFATPVMADTDEILNYTITVDVNQDATLNLNYHIDWKVLDSGSGIGPLTWMNIGIPNSHVISAEGISSTVDHINRSGNYVEVYLDRSYYEGEVASVDFLVVQDYMYQVDKLTEGETVYSFTPGWFDDIKVDELVIQWNNDKSVFNVLQILIACRKRDKKKVINSNSQFVLLESYLNSLDGVMVFIEGSGLAKVFKDKNIKNLVDYVFGVEVGLDSNARKNRSGDAMENAVELIIKGSRLKYRKEVYSSEWPAITQALGTDKKRFDFVIETKNKTYLAEVNFYSGGGSKLNETARSFTELAPKINAVKGFEFLWVTDGKGWYGAKNKLEEAYYTIPSVYNLTTLSGFLEGIKEP